MWYYAAGGVTDIGCDEGRKGKITRMLHIPTVTVFYKKKIEKPMNQEAEQGENRGPRAGLK